MILQKTLFCLLPTVLLQAGYSDRPEARAFVQTMVERHHFDPSRLLGLLQEVQPQEKARQWVLPPTGTFHRSWKTYRARFLERTRIRAGAEFWGKHEKDLLRARQQYGVPEEVIVGILGVETLYGRNTGTFPVLDTLATLAFDFPETPKRNLRQAMFIQELEAYLLWCRDAGQDPRAMKGSYTGAMGLPQFLPSSLRSWAVDFDGDGRIDLQNSPSDAIGSVANYLKAHGWEAGAPVDLPVAGGPISQSVAARHADGVPETRLRLGALQKEGLTISSRSRKAPEAQVLVIDLPTPEHRTVYRVGFTNFQVLTQYNRSYFYAAAVMDLGRAVKIHYRASRRAIMKKPKSRP